ncbi:sensor histidine kinase [Hoeflea sp.]|uniref:sensor histidine kinase n=1 Tax=Hoeflea sp. TaxID=1940281 RepID=UPI003B52A7C6
MKSIKKTDRLRFMLAGLQHASVSMLYQDADLVIRFSANLPEDWPSDSEVEGKSDDALFTAAQAAKIVAAKRQVIQTGEATKLEILREAEGERHWFMLHIDPDIEENGAVTGVFTTILDIDDLKYRETVLKTLLRELSHRSKNLLAIIQSVASQTARSSDGLDDFLLAFRNRVQSMSKSQDLVTASDWRGAELFELTRSQLSPLFGEIPQNFSVSGQDAYLLPNAALHLGLALHELAIDSLAHGALGPAGGDIVLSARHGTDENGAAELEVIWSETFTRAPKLPAQSKTSFSRTVLGRIVPQALSAQVTYDMSETRLTYRLVIPASQYEADQKQRA